LETKLSIVAKKNGTRGFEHGCADPLYNFAWPFADAAALRGAFLKEFEQFYRFLRLVEMQ
jgi:hypothetical protein